VEKLKPADLVLIAALGDRRLDDAKKAIENGADVNRQIDGIPLLHYAALRGDAEELKLLIDGGAEIDARDFDGRTALMWSAWLGQGDGQQKIMDQLIASGADVNASDSRGKRILDWAVQFLNRAAVNLLLEHGAEPSKSWRSFVRKTCREKGLGRG
jgi:ankyrin repeat protein